jgi:hypothetical protein
MSNHDERLVELMSLMLEEMREMKQEQRRMRKEQETTNEKIEMMNTRLGALEFVIREERTEFRSRIERLESAVARAGFL